jgi:hypothetical protein
MVARKRFELSALQTWIFFTVFRGYDPAITYEGVDETRSGAISPADCSNNSGCFLGHSWQICLFRVAYALLSWDKGYREPGASGNAETAAKAFEPVIFEFASFEVAGPEDAPVNASTATHTLLRILLGNELRCEDLGCYSMAKKSS